MCGTRGERAHRCDLVTSCYLTTPLYPRHEQSQEAIGVSRGSLARIGDEASQARQEGDEEGGQGRRQADRKGDRLGIVSKNGYTQ